MLRGELSLGKIVKGRFVVKKDADGTSCPKGEESMRRVVHGVEN